jgi:hypothetical protein
LIISFENLIYISNFGNKKLLNIEALLMNNQKVEKIKFLNQKNFLLFLKDKIIYYELS